MSIINTYDPSEESILSPSFFAKPVPGFPSTIIVTFSRYMFNTFLQHWPCKTIDTMFDGRKIYELMYGNKAFALIRSSIGAPPTVALLEEAIVKGVEKILIFGSCGTLDASLTDSSIIVPTHAYRDEGTSYHYMPADESGFVEVATAGQTAEILQNMGIPTILGKTWTTDALFRETRQTMLKRKNAGCITVEMECASVMAMAHFRKKKAYQFLYAADNLDAEEWQRRSLSALPTDSRERFAKIALDLALQL